MIRQHDEHPELCYHDCPCCGRRLMEPFLRHGSPQAVTHHRGRGHAPCRVVVVPGVTSYPVPDGATFEDVLARLVRRRAAA